MTQRSILTVVCGKAPEAISAQHGGYVDWFRQALGPGIELEPWDGRMGRGPLMPRRDDTVYGMAIGALG